MNNKKWDHKVLLNLRKFRNYIHVCDTLKIRRRKNIDGIS